MTEAYRSFSGYCKEVFGRKLHKAALDAGMSCPNRDGRRGRGGCIFCDEGGSGDFAIPYRGQRLYPSDLSYFHGEAREGDFIAYFQAYTNTYAPLPYLEKMFTSALSDPLFAGISIATRPDAMGEEVMDLLSRLKEAFPDKFIWIELGLQTMHEETAALIRRGYLLPVFEECTRQLKDRAIPFFVHIIFGLPGETKEDMLQTIRYVSVSGAFGVKLQLLHILKDTDLYELYKTKPFHVLTLEEYADLTAEAVGFLKEDIIIARLTGDGKKELLIEPDWSLDKRRVLNTIRHTLKIRGITQGCFLKEPASSAGLLCTQKESGR